MPFYIMINYEQNQSLQNIIKKQMAKGTANRHFISKARNLLTIEAETIRKIDLSIIIHNYDGLVRKKSQDHYVPF